MAKKKEVQTPGEYGDMYQDFLSSSMLKKKKEKKESFYISFCRTAKKFVKAPDTFKKDEYKGAVDFLEIPLKPSEINAAPVFAMMLSLIFIIPAMGFILFSIFVSRTMELPILMYTLPVSLLVPFGLVWYFQNYPLKEAENKRMQTITQIPEVVNYMVMSMKLTPNLERAVEFAAEHGTGNIANDLKKLVSDVRLGNYNTMEEALDVFAYKWARYSDEFKHALMLIRGSVIEIDDAKRHVMLDKAASDVLEGISDNMEKYAGKMRQPSIYLYYMGVLLPLLLIIILPVGSVLGNLPLAQTWILILLYNILIPLGTVYFAMGILKTRPPVYTPPKIPDNFPGLPKKNHLLIGKTSVPSIVLAIIAVIAIYTVFAFVVEPIFNPYPPAWNTEAQQAWVPMMAITGAVVGIAVGISIWLYGSAYYKRKEQLKIMKMEDEFKDSVYIVASRLGENRPVEEALDYTAEFMKGTSVSEIFRKASNNIHNLGMTVEMALFDPVYGALKYVPSHSIKNSMRILIDSIQLGVQQGSKALLSLSLQLRDAHKIKEKIRSLLSEITAMMTSIAFFIGPIVLGITTALQKIVVSALTSLTGVSGLSGETTAYVSDLPMMSFGSEEILSGIPSPIVFIFIIAVYVLEVTLILTYFTSRIQEGRNDLAMKMTIASSLPVSMLLFFISAFVASSFTVIL